MFSSPTIALMLTSCATDLLAVLLALLLARPFVRRWRLLPGALLLLYVIADDVIALTPLLAGWNPGRWNWIGQGASIAFALLATALLLDRREVGLRWPRGAAALGWSGLGILVAVAISVLDNLLATPATPTMPDVETIAYEALMPGPAEELAFRGVGLALLVRMFRDGQQDRRAVAVAAVATAIWFTAGHVVHLTGERFVLAPRRVLDVLPMGLLFALLRIRSGSLLGGMLAHSLADVAAEIVGAVRA